MYKLLKVHSLKLTHNTSAPTKRTYMQKSYLCSFCKFHHSQLLLSKLTYQQLEHYSTIKNNAQQNNLCAIKAKRRNVKYIELLEVTKTTTSNTRTAVKKLNAANISMLITDNPLSEEDRILRREKIMKDLTSVRNESGVTEESQQEKTRTDFVNKTPMALYKKKSKKTKHVMKNLAGGKQLLFSNFNNCQDHLVTEDAASEIMNCSQDSNPAINLDVDPEESLFLDSLNKNYKTCGKKGKSLLLNDEMRNLIDHLRQENEIQYYNSYFDTYSRCGKLKEAFETFLFFRKREKSRSRFALRDISIFNLFLREFSRRGDMKNVKKLTNIIRDDKIRMNVDSLAYILVCVGRIPNPLSEIAGFLKSVEKDMKKEGINFNSIITKSTFSNDQMEKALQVIRLIDPAFQPYFEAQDIRIYNCRLLNDLFSVRNFESPAVGLLTKRDLEVRTNKQIEVEERGYVIIKSVATKQEPTPEVLSAREKMKELDKSWREEAIRGFERNIEALKLREKRLMMTHLHPFLIILDKEDYVNAILTEAKQVVETGDAYSFPISSLAKQLGKKLFKRYETKVYKDEGALEKVIESYKRYCDWYLEGGSEENARIKWQSLEYDLKKSGTSLNFKVPQWTPKVMKNVGKFLYEIIVKDLKINVSFKKGKEIYVPAFYSVFRSVNKACFEEIRPHPNLTKLYRDAQVELLNFEADFVPSLSPPRPWISIDQGGYLIRQSSIIRIPIGAVQQWRKLNEIPKKQIFPAFDCLNQLGTIPWKVNTSILDVAVKVFQEGGSVKLNVPQPPSILDNTAVLASPTGTSSSMKEERAKKLRARMELKRRKNEMYSLWCDALYKLSLANHYREEIFWLPHNMDFRGRVYPIPPHLSQMGSDFARSMLIFAKKKPLGLKGLDWLKIHVINLTGLKKKESIETRLKYANEILEDILDSAEKPLTGKMWWANSDEPWQTLAACMEISKALKFKNPEEYLTGFPIHQDGSCNGLQHYAALGRDQIGAKSVNLSPFDKPQDIYSDVVVLVEKTRKADAERGLEIARVVDGFIQRKVIKQTIMTTVYGVTKFGAKLQIAKQLEDIENFPQDKVWAASDYLVRKTFESLRTMFKSAREIQDWFTDCAKLICSVRGKSVEWVTPLGLPVIQPYMKSNSMIFPASDLFQSPNMMKQKNAFPPNFIHSLDSTHMMLTSLYCEQVGITFMSVHDCFWTHPCSVESMNEICRKQFIALHSEPILENLSRFLLERYAFFEKELNETEDVKTLEMRQNLNKVLSKIPAKGTFDLEKVQSSTYFFS